MHVTDNDGLARPLAQTAHAALTEIVDPSCDNSLGNSGGCGGIGDGPAVDDYPLDDLAALCGG